MKEDLALAHSIQLSDIEKRLKVLEKIVDYLELRIQRLEGNYKKCL